MEIDGMGKVNRHDRLSEDAAAAAPVEAGADCPCCGEPLSIGEDGAVRCECCGYPRNSAAWVAYDGCC